MTTQGRAASNPHTFARLCISLQVILSMGLVHPQSRLDQQILEKFQQGHYQEASELASRAVQQDSSNAVYQELYGMVLAALGKSSEAEVHLRKAVALRPQQAEFHYNLAQLLLDRQEASGLHPFAPSTRRLMEEAISELQSVLEITPENVEARMALARSYNNLNFSEMALKQYSMAVAKEPSRPWLHFQMGMLHSNLSNLEKAMEEFGREIGLYPDHARARIELAELLLQTGETTKAKQHLLRAETELDQSLKHRAHYLLAKVHRDLGEPQKALTALRKSIDLCDSFLYPHYLLAQLYRETEQLDLARQTLERVESLRSRDSSSADPFAFREGHCPGESR